MRVEAMTEKGEVRFSEECKHLLDLRDEISTKGDKKHAKREAKALLKHKYYWKTFLIKKMIRDRTMWDQTDGCAKQYRCSIAYYMTSFLSKSYQIVIDRAVDTPGHGKDVVDGFNAVQKRYLATCLIMRSTPENRGSCT